MSAAGGTRSSALQDPSALPREDVLSKECTLEVSKCERYDAGSRTDSSPAGSASAYHSRRKPRSRCSEAGHNPVRGSQVCQRTASATRLEELALDFNLHQQAGDGMANPSASFAKYQKRPSASSLLEGTRSSKESLPRSISRWPPPMGAVHEVSNEDRISSSAQSADSTSVEHDQRVSAHLKTSRTLVERSRGWRKAWSGWFRTMRPNKGTREPIVHESADVIVEPDKSTTTPRQLRSQRDSYQAEGPERRLERRQSSTSLRQPSIRSGKSDQHSIHVPQISTGRALAPCRACGRSSSRSQRPPPGWELAYLPRRNNRSSASSRSGERFDHEPIWVQHISQHACISTPSVNPGLFMALFLYPQTFQPTASQPNAASASSRDALSPTGSKPPSTEHLGRGGSGETLVRQPGSRSGPPPDIVRIRRSTGSLQRHEAKPISTTLRSI